MNEGKIKCQICGCASSKQIFCYKKPDKYELSVGVKPGKGYFRKWVCCTRCGFYYSLYSRDTKILDSIYTLAYRSTASSWRKETPEERFKKIISLPAKGSETKFRIDWIKKSISNIWKDGVLKKGKAPFKMLDIGGGSGVFAYEFRDKNWKSYVIDPNKGSIFLRKLGIPLVQESYKPGKFRYKFDLISLNYALEHMKNPEKMLKDLSGDMKKNSLLFIEVPDSLCFRHRPCGDDIFNSCHLWFFSPGSMSILLHSCGFEIVKLCRMKTIRGHYALMLLAMKRNNR